MHQPIDHEITFKQETKWEAVGLPIAYRPVCSCGWRSTVCGASERLAFTIGSYHLAKERQCEIVLTTNIAH